MTCRGIRQEALLSFVQWQRCSPPDERPEMHDKGKTDLMNFFKVYQYDDSSIRPVIYEDDECMTRRGIITSLALIRDHDESECMEVLTISFTPNDILDFLLDQLRSHDYVSSPLVYDADEEYIAALLYSSPRCRHERCTSVSRISATPRARTRWAKSSWSNATRSFRASFRTLPRPSKEPFL